MNRAEFSKFQELAGEGDQTWVTEGSTVTGNFYMVYFPIATDIRAITIGGVSSPAALLTPRTMAAGTTLYNVTSIQLQDAGTWAVCYTEPS
jgi:hypothetical protein